MQIVLIMTLNHSVKVLALTDSLLTPSSRINLQQIRDWFASPLGDELLQTESAILEQLLAGLFGYHLLQVSVQQQELFEASPIQHKVTLGLTEQDKSPFFAQPTKLPLENDGTDVVLVHHLLDFVDSPQEALRELSRVVLPSGYLVIVGFNPLSLWGLWKSIARWRKLPPWNGLFIRPGRLMDWMNLLNFKIDRAQFCTYGLPIVHNDAGKPDFSKGLSRNANFPVGAVYVIVARKQIRGMTPIRPVWKSQRAFGQLSIVRTTNRNVLSRIDLKGSASRD
ncbi:MAG: methyltransferase domain-containing protein [Gammaproteobacteria bacterium]|nr:methyltransferase domain-containing protein [Gammaproteobacteria bacterium]